MKCHTIVRTLCAFAAVCAMHLGEVRAAGIARLTVESDPTGADVFVDGVNRGQTPLVVDDLKGGRCHLKVRHENYLDYDEFVSTEEGFELRKDVVLEEEKGLLLLKSEPTGCSIRIDGSSYGVTPRFVDDLPTRKEHVVSFSKPGFRDQKVKVKFSGRDPLVCEEHLMRDSGIVRISSEPQGAKVVINGIVRGVTPLEASNIPHGLAVVRLSLSGYEEVTEEIKLNAGDEQELSVKMIASPGSLQIFVQPQSAVVYVDDVAGIGSTVISHLAPGTHVVRCEADGYEPVRREVEVKSGETAREEFHLKSVMGRLEIRTVPGGAEVVIDGKKVGSTKAVGSDPNEPSELLTVEDIKAGEHTLVVRKNGYREIFRPLDIEAKKTFRIPRMTLKTVFSPDIEIQTDRGPIKGVFKRREGSVIVIDIKPGIEYSVPVKSATPIRFLSEE